MESQSSSVSSNSLEHDEAKKELEGYLNKRMRIGISDGRVIDGMFLCTDKECNIVLGNCEEFLSQDEVGMLILVLMMIMKIHTLQTNMRRAIRKVPSF